MIHNIKCIQFIFAPLYTTRVETIGGDKNLQEYTSFGIMKVAFLSLFFKIFDNIFKINIQFSYVLFGVENFQALTSFKFLHHNGSY